VTIDYNERAQPIFKCRHRGKGCGAPGRSAHGLERAALLGLRLLADDVDLQEAIRQELRRHEALPTPAPSRQAALAALDRKRRKLLDLHYADRITDDLFAEEEARLTTQMDALRDAERKDEAAQEERDDLAARFEKVAALLRDLDIDRMWAAATPLEKRSLVEDLVEAVVIHPDRLVVEVAGAPPLLVTLAEVGLRADRARESRTSGTRSSVSEGGLEPPRPCGH
jgi:hypothetical protein